jgi:hypothetical protein
MRERLLRCLRVLFRLSWHRLLALLLGKGLLGRFPLGRLMQGCGDGRCDPRADPRQHRDLLGRGIPQPPDRAEMAQ